MRKCSTEMKMTGIIHLQWVWGCLPDWWHVSISSLGFLILNSNLSNILFQTMLHGSSLTKLLTDCSWVNKMSHIIAWVYPNVKNFQHSIHLSLYLSVIPKQVSNQVCVPCSLQILPQLYIYLSIYQERENVSLFTYRVAEECVENDNPAVKHRLYNHCFILPLEFSSCLFWLR